jgi:SAM-dependent methyltransferase
VAFRLVERSGTVPGVSRDSLAQIAGRLASGSAGRTEADIQSDVRKFLLDAPLDLGGADLVDVALERQAGGGRRIDVEAGCAAIEVKKSLRSPAVLADAVEQLTGYVRQRTAELGQRYVGVLTDGQTWLLYHLRPDATLARVDELSVTSAEDAPALSAWLEVVLATTDQITPTPREILRRLGAGSPGFDLDLADLRALYASCRDHPEVQLKRELWARLLVAALGTNFEATDELFVTHTYLVLTAELLAHVVVGISVGVPGTDVRALLEGQQFELAGLHGVVEADFFDWPAVTDAGIPVVRAIARRLSRFDWSQVEHDVLKALYESVIDAPTRRKLGEYYTPDWLAERMVEGAFADPANERVLDPACGSGTFLFWAVRRALAAYEAEGLSNHDALARVVTHVSGIDLHPVAVTLARVTYLLAIGRARLLDRGELTIPVFLGDSVRWEQDATLLAQGGITIHTSDGMELFAQELHFPEGVLRDPERFDRLVAALADRAANRDPPTRARLKPVIPPITAILNAQQVAEADRPALEMVFEKLCRLHDARRNHVWGYYIRNIARPLSFTRPDGQVDVLVGNPPWLAYRNMPERIQASYRQLASARGLWAGAKVATNQDLSDLFVARAVEQYLRPGGRFSFVMPYSVLSRRQFAGFRSGDWTSQGGGVLTVAFDGPEDFARVKPPLFPMPSCVISGSKGGPPVSLPAASRRWIGRVASHHASWAAASAGLTDSANAVVTAYDSAESPYRSRFSQGATLVPSVLVRVQREPVGPLGHAAGQLPVASARSALEKPPWRDIGTLRGLVEEQFLRPMHTGATMVAFRPREPELVIVPWLDGDLLDGSSERLDAFPGLAAWWRRAERLWSDNKTARSNMKLLDRLDYQHLLRRQLPPGRHRVVYSASGQHLAACRVEDASVIEHKLYWASVESLEEARYLVAILNSQTLKDAVAPLQSRGQHNPRDFDLHVFGLPFPIFDPRADLHARIAHLAHNAEIAAAGIDLDAGWQFQKARRVVREALVEDGIAGEIDAAVRELLERAEPRMLLHRAQPLDRDRKAAPRHRSPRWPPSSTT